MEFILTSTLVIIAVWSFALAIATGRMMTTVHKGGGDARKEDWFQLLTSLLVSGISVAALITTPAFILSANPGLIALELGTIVLLEYLTERVVLSCKGIKQRFSNPS